MESDNNTMETMKPKKSKKGIIILIAVLLCAVVGVLLFTVILPGNRRADADDLRAQGKLVEAEAVYAKLEQTSEIQNIRRDLFYESRALHCALLLKNTLIVPESLKIREALVSTPGSSGDQPSVILHYTATSSGGYTVNKYVYFAGSTYSYEMYASVDTLNSDNIPSYLDRDERLNWLRTISLINLSAYSQNIIMNDDQLNEINAILANDKIRSMGFVDYGSAVPRPTPRQTSRPVEKPSNTTNIQLEAVQDAIDDEPTVENSYPYELIESEEKEEISIQHDQKTALIDKTSYFGTWKPATDDGQSNEIAVIIEDGSYRLKIAGHEYTGVWSYSDDGILTIDGQVMAVPKIENNRITLPINGSQTIMMKDE